MEEKIRFDITGMSCAACSSNIERAVRKMGGVKKADVNLLANTMVAEIDTDVTNADNVVTVVEKIGFGASYGDEKTAAQPEAAQADHMQTEIKSMVRRLVISLIFMLPLMYVSMGPMLGLPLPGFLSGPQNAVSFALTQFILTLPVIIVNHHYFTSGFRALVNRTPNMDSLIAVGVTAAMAYGIFALYRIGWGLGHQQLDVVSHYMHELYFESAAMILTLITLGKTLETRSKGQTGAAINALLDLAPKTAIAIIDGEEKEIPLEDVTIGMHLAVKPGARVPIDGVVVEGHSAVDESALTGESMPVDKVEGDFLTGATLNTSGYVVMETQRVGEDTTLAQIIALVEEAGASKAPIAQLADRVAGVFVPVVMAIALIAFAAWIIVGYGVEFAMARAITVLVISCPCALGLATPVAIMVGTGRGAKNGILYKNAEALETFSHVNTVILDKTGTITQGEPMVTDIIPYNLSEKELLEIATGLELQSEHPIALAIVQKAEENGIEPAATKNFEALPGFGLKATVNGKASLAGNERLMRENNISLDALDDSPERLANEGKTPLFFAHDGKLVGVIAVADLPKADSAAAIKALRQRGLRTIMLTGDNERTAQAMKAIVGVDEVIAEVLPQDKEQVVRELMESGHNVAMIGDGINDAPALARADIGVAIGAGTDVAIESADVVLMKSTLADAVTAFDLSRAVLRNIKQNLFWAFFYNIIGIPIAAGVFYAPFGLTLNPMIGAAAMSLSSLFVVTNALRLNTFRAEPLPQITGGSNKPHRPSGDTTPTPKQPIIKETKAMEKTMKIEGMSCGHCKARVEEVLGALPGVKAVVDLDSHSAKVTADSDVSDDTLKKTVEDAGYDVISIS